MQVSVTIDHQTGECLIEFCAPKQRQGGLEKHFIQVSYIGLKQFLIPEASLHCLLHEPAQHKKQTSANSPVLSSM